MLLGTGVLVAAEWGHFTATKRRLLAACGAGAGIAAEYNVPFGGALFTLEVLLGTLSPFRNPPPEEGTYAWRTRPAR